MTAEIGEAHAVGAELDGARRRDAEASSSRASQPGARPMVTG
ncbi:MAG TPA: hypothetical protein VKZ63_05250 [Kofleriaceae bacterium]|nr:hypothetical protein [Kofleriaceae bacterium]